MARTTTKRRKPRKARSARGASSLAALARMVGAGWGRFALGILVGLALGIGGALYLDDVWPRGALVVATQKPAQNSFPIQKQKPAESPKVVELEIAVAKTKPEGEEAKQKVAGAPAPVIVDPVIVEPATPPVQSASIAPAPVPMPAGKPAWLRNAVAFNPPPGRPMIAIVLDDVGVSASHAELAIDLPAVITLSFMTYAEGVAGMAARAKAKGHELMLHVPMEPMNYDVDPGPHVLTVDAPEADLLKRLAWGLDRFPGYIGINNHMGSRFTQNERGMKVVLTELQRRGLLFLDSRTISNTVSDRIAAKMGLPHVMRDVFLDDEMGEAAVLKQLAQTEKVALAKGQAIAIGHPHPTTISAIRIWMKNTEARGFVIVPLSTVAKQRLGASG